MLRLRTNSGVFSYSFSFTNPIQIPESGDYILSLYTLFNCQRAGCDTVGDTISIKIKTNLNADFEEVFKTGTDQARNKDIKWNREEVKVQLVGSEFYVFYFSKVFFRNCLSDNFF